MIVFQLPREVLRGIERRMKINTTSSLYWMNEGGAYHPQDHEVWIDGVCPPQYLFGVVIFTTLAMIM